MASFLRKFVDVSQVLVRIFVPAIALIYAVMAGIPPSPHEIGTHAIVFDERARGFVTDGNNGHETGHRIRVVDFGLEQGMGLAFKPGKPDHVYVADAWDAIFDCELDRENLRCVNDGTNTRQRRVPALDVCPFGQCIAVEHGGLALGPEGVLYVSDAHQRRVAKRDLSNPSKVDSIGDEVLGRIHDVGLFGGDAVIVAEGPVDDGHDQDEKDAGEKEATGTSDKALTKASVYELSATGKKKPVTSGFTHPVGVAYSSRTGRLYVADISGRIETWRYFERERQPERDQVLWREKGVLWSQTLRSADDWPRLQAMVIGQAAGADGEGIFAAGPDGLYVFHSDGTLLAKYVLRTPVSGLVWGRHDSVRKTTELFMTVGRRLSVLKTRATPVDPHLPPVEPHATPALSASTTPLTSQPPPGASARPRPPTSPARDDSEKPSQPAQSPPQPPRRVRGGNVVKDPIRRPGPVAEPATVKSPGDEPSPRGDPEPTAPSSPCTCDGADKGRLR